MSLMQRIAIALGILILDLVVFFLPLTAIAVAVIIIWRPIPVFAFVLDLYDADDMGVNR
jgi:hypothetical protein